MEENQVSDAKLRAMAKHCIENNPQKIRNGEFDQVKTSLLEAIGFHTKIIDQTDDDYYEMAVLHYNLAALYESYFHDNSNARQCYQLAIEYLNKIKNPEQEDVDLMKVYQWHISKLIKPDFSLSQVELGGHLLSSNVDKNSQVETSMANNDQEKVGNNLETKSSKPC